MNLVDKILWMDLYQSLVTSLLTKQTKLSHSIMTFNYGLLHKVMASMARAKDNLSKPLFISKVVIMRQTPSPTQTN
jgi:hypothetical protein